MEDQKLVPVGSIVAVGTEINSWQGVLAHYNLNGTVLVLFTTGQYIIAEADKVRIIPDNTLSSLALRLAQDLREELGLKIDMP